MKILEKILLSTDFSKSSNNIVDYAIELAKAFDAKISLINVLPDDIKNEKAKSLLNDAAIRQLSAINEKINDKGIKTDDAILEYGNISDKVIQTAYSINANLILIGAGEKSENDAFQLGTTSEKIIRKSDKPVWVVKNNSILDIKNIICPVDFSDESKRALKNAITLTRRFKAKLIIFNAYKIDYPTALISKMDWDEENDRKVSEQTSSFKQFLEGFNLKDLNWDKEIKGGDPATEIRKAIVRYKSDLNVMGTSGKTGLNRLIMGSVTEKVIREVPCSFITLKTEDFISLKLEKRISNINNHYEIAVQLMDDGYFEESINEFEYCLNINEMHVPSLKGLSQVYEKLGNTDYSESYDKIAKEVLVKIWDKQIEAELRNKHLKN
ncbi:MAG: universal stress protein [Flavobacteriaceae bacterium]|nr:universal stress protein [Flavobacteriaceae bacterium]